MRERPPTDSSKAWAKNLTQRIWAHFLDVWKLRCDKRHELDTSRVSKQHTHRVIGRAQACYAVLPDLPGVIRLHRYFDKTINEQLDTDTS
jgi:hypothetical protein